MGSGLCQSKEENEEHKREMYPSKLGVGSAYISGLDAFEHQTLNDILQANVERGTTSSKTTNWTSSEAILIGDKSRGK